MNPNNSQSIRRMDMIKAVLSDKPMMVAEISAAVFLNECSVRQYLAYLHSERLIYIAAWPKNNCARGAAYRLGRRKDVPRPAPRTIAQYNQTYRAKLTSDPVRHDLRLSKRRAKTWAARASEAPKSWMSSLL